MQIQHKEQKVIIDASANSRFSKRCSNSRINFSSWHAQCGEIFVLNPALLQPNRVQFGRELSKEAKFIIDPLEGFNSKPRFPLFNFISNIFSKNEFESPKVFLPDTQLASIDLGTGYAKLSIATTDGDILPKKEHQKRARIDLSNFLKRAKEGSSNNQTTLLNFKEITRLKKAIKHFSNLLAKHNITEASQVKITGTEWLRHANPEQIEKIFSDRDANPLSLKPDVLDTTDEGNVAYRSAVRHLGLKENTKTIFFEIGSGSTEWMFGTGPSTTDGYFNRYLPIGSKSLGLSDPFNYKQIKEAKKLIVNARQAVAKKSTGAYQKILKNEVEDRIPLISPSIPFRVLREILIQKGKADIFELERTPTDKDEEIIRLQNGLTLETVNHFLSPQGLKELASHVQKLEKEKNKGFNWFNKKKIEDRINTIQNIPRKLLILQESMQYLGLEKINFANSGGLKVGLLVDKIKEQKQIRYEKTIAKTLHEKFENQAKKSIILNGFQRKLQGLGHISFQAKSEKSIIEKLLYRYIDTKQDYKTPEEAMKTITDGVRGRLILNNTSEEGVAEMVELLISQIGSGTIEVLGIDNYPASWSEIETLINSEETDKLTGYLNKNGIPYLNAENCIKLSKAIKKASEQHQLKKSRDKKWGYTTLQFDLRIKDDKLESGFVDVELQVRGTPVNWIGELDRILYDIRNGKDLPSDLKKFKLHAEILKNQFGNDQMNSYYNYIKDWYRYARQLELSDPTAQKPQFPDDKLKIFDKSNVLGKMSLTRTNRIKFYDASDYFKAETMLKKLKGRNLTPSVIDNPNESTPFEEI